MARYRFAIEYLGTDYAGWQEQPGQRTVQAELAAALKTCLRAEVALTGAGRTDAGVHARGQVAHFDCEGPLDPRRVEHSVNALTGDDVFVRRLEACAGDFHARYRALSRTYHYRIARRPVALMGHISWYPGFALDEGLFRAELVGVMGRRDFVNFSVPRDDGKGTHCHVLEADLRADRDFLTVVLSADRFLHKMVRSIVGACFDVARGARPPGLAQGILDDTYRGEWTWAPARGLCLEKVAYEDYDV